MRSMIDFCKGLPEETFAAGACLLEEGHKSGVLYILAEGSVEVLKGDFQINTVAEPGALFGEVSALLGLPHMATVKALEPSRFFVVRDPDTFLRSHPDIALGLSKLLARRLHYVTTYLVDLKNQFESRDDHLGMVDEVLESLVHHQEDD